MIVEEEGIREGLGHQIRAKQPAGAYQEQNVRLDEEGLGQSCPHTPAS